MRSVIHMFLFLTVTILCSSCSYQITQRQMDDWFPNGTLRSDIHSKQDPDFQTPAETFERTGEGKFRNSYVDATAKSVETKYAVRVTRCELYVALTSMFGADGVYVFYGGDDRVVFVSLRKAYFYRTYAVTV